MDASIDLTEGQVFQDRNADRNLHQVASRLRQQVYGASHDYPWNKFVQRRGQGQVGFPDNKFLQVFQPDWLCDLHYERVCERCGSPYRLPWKQVTTLCTDCDYLLSRSTFLFQGGRIETPSRWEYFIESDYLKTRELMNQRENDFLDINEFWEINR